jgi:hypothetical protein
MTKLSRVMDPVPSPSLCLAGYDVKGSTHNRKASEKELSKQRLAILKDEDLVSRKRFLLVRTTEEKEQLMALLAADVAWLQRHGLIDYSFLIGYISKEDGISAAEGASPVVSPQKVSVDVGRGGNPLLQTPPLKKKSDAGNGASPPSGKDANRFAVRLLPVLDPDFSAAYVGIIDILTQYGARKRAEHCCLGVMANRPGASCQPPNAYGNRLVRFVDVILLALDEGGGRGGVTVDKLREERSQRARAWLASHGRDPGSRAGWMRLCGCFSRRGKTAVQTRDTEVAEDENSTCTGYDSVSLT